MAEPLQRMSDIINEQNNPVAKAQEVVLKGFDGESYPTISVDSEGRLDVNAEVVVPPISVGKDSILAGPAEDTGYNYIGYKKPDGTFYIKRQNLTTYLWEYSYFNDNFSTNWTNKENLTYGEPN